MTTNSTTIDVRFVCCATCKYWSGDSKYNFPGTVTMTNDSKGPCNNTYFGAETMAIASCSYWEQRYINR